MFDQSCCQRLPSRCAGIGPFSGTSVAVLLAEPMAHVGVERDVEAAGAAPRDDPAPCANASGGMSYLLRHIAPVSAKPSVARALVRQLDEPRVVLPHRNRDGVPAFPDLLQALRIAALREDLRDRLDVEAILALRPARTILAAAVHAFHRPPRSRVSSSASFGSGGAAIVSEVRSRSSCRRSTGVTFASPNFAACFANSVTALTSASFASAAIVSVSTVMCVDCVQPARLAAFPSRSISAFTCSRKTRASGGGAWEDCAEMVIASRNEQQAAELRRPIIQTS